MMTVPADCVCAQDYEHYFAARVDPAVRAYVDGSAADGLTAARNRASFDRHLLMPRVLRDMRQASAATTLFGTPFAFPLGLAPTAYHKLVHPDGEAATALGAALTGTPMIVSTLSSTPVETLAAIDGAHLWFQLYAQPRWPDTVRLLRRAEAAGCRAIVMTVDAPLNGIRNMEQRAGFRLPAHIEAVHLRDMAPLDGPAMAPGSPVFQGLLAHAPTWDTLAAVCAATALPVLAKGILAPNDAEQAVAVGCAGIIVSNHGGRVLDSTPAALEMLPHVAATIDGRVPLLVDGGIRRGTDILKALALGARAVLLGRPVLHALAVGGPAGVAHLLTVLRTELEAAMALTGCPRISDIDAGVLAASTVSPR
ncbi:MULTISPECIES: alpha-hydroxy acid oxidase [unclassified Xanthobacter]|uniref:alpha-hydroxy acid oxidase n=1 Tax=unclassified Xanthobacter TaxID=2623496 RepID=UPI001EE06B6F|nr:MULTISPECIES: alpha-hydroxy acid oxidase [unclassified Xanthobacter]